MQGTLEEVLRRILQEPVRIVGSGRTDAGVHALAQVAHVQTRSMVSLDRLLRSVNALLPPDIAVTRIEEAPAAFHARFHATRKRYRYRFFTGLVVPPFIRPYVHHLRTPVHVPLMRREAAALRGRHDFRAFARRGQGATARLIEAPGHGAAARPARVAARGRGTRRTITDVRLRRRGDELHLDVEGDGFLHTMVRSIAGTLVDVGRGRLPAGTVRRMLRAGDRRLAGTTAPAHGLTLLSVDYGQGFGVDRGRSR